MKPPNNYTYRIKLYQTFYDDRFLALHSFCNRMTSKIDSHHFTMGWLHCDRFSMQTIFYFFYQLAKSWRIENTLLEWYTKWNAKIENDYKIFAKIQNEKINFNIENDLQNRDVLKMVKLQKSVGFRWWVPLFWVHLTVHKCSDCKCVRLARTCDCNFDICHRSHTRFFFCTAKRRTC